MRIPRGPRFERADARGDAHAALELDYVRAGAAHYVGGGAYALFVAGLVGAEGQVDHDKRVACPAHDRGAEVDHLVDADLVGGLVAVDHVRG